MLASNHLMRGKPSKGDPGTTSESIGYVVMELAQSKMSQLNNGVADCNVFGHSQFP